MKLKLILSAIKYFIFSIVTIALLTNCVPKHKLKTANLTALESGDLSSSSVTTKSCDDREAQLMELFKNAFHQKAISHCASCHGNNQAPKFALSDVAPAYGYAKPYFNANNVPESIFYYRSTNGHCGLACASGSPQSKDMLAALNSWANMTKSLPECVVVANETPTPQPPPPPPLPSPTPKPLPIPEPIPIPIPSGLSLKGTVGIMDFSQLVPAMAAVTGVDSGSTSVQTYFVNSMTRMSMDGSAESVSPALLLSYTTLGSIFCSGLITKEIALLPANREFFKSVDMNAGPSGFTEPVQTQVIQSLANQFWSRNANTEEVMIFKSLYLEAGPEIIAQAKTNQEKLKALLLISCTTAISSMEFLKN